MEIETVRITVIIFTASQFLHILDMQGIRKSVIWQLFLKEF